MIACMLREVYSNKRRDIGRETRHEPRRQTSDRDPKIESTIEKDTKVWQRAHSTLATVKCDLCSCFVY